MKKTLHAVGIMLLLVIPAWQWSIIVSVPGSLFDYQLPPGQWCYLLSKLVAQYAFLLLSVQLVVGFGMVNAAGNHARPNIKAHRVLGMFVFCSALLHIILFVAAAWLRSGDFPDTLFTIQFNRGYYNLFVSIGLIAACLLVFVAMAGLARNHLPFRVFPYGHRLAWLVWLLGFWHSYAIGTEVNGGAIWSWLYVFSVLIIVFLMFYRIFAVF